LTAADRNNLGSGKEDASLSLSASFGIEKLLPPSWGARLPFSYSWSRRTSIPRLKSGSDIVIPDELREQETTRSYSQSFRISEAFNKKTNNWLWNLTLNKFKSSLSYSSSRSKSPTVLESNSETYSASGRRRFQRPSLAMCRRSCHSRVT
jgi:cell surface protein SprA